MSGSPTQNRQCVGKHSHPFLDANSHLSLDLTVPTRQLQGDPPPPGIMSLLTPSEARAFQSFLTSLDAADFSAEWNMQLDIPHGHVPPSQGKEALTKATRDLMSLDADKWRHPLRQSPGNSLGVPGQRYPQPQSSFSVLFSGHPHNAPGAVYNEPSPSSSRLQPGTSTSRPQLPPFESSHERSTHDQTSSPPTCRTPTGPSASSSSTQSSTPGPSSAKRSPPLDPGADGKRHRLSNVPAAQSSPGDAKSSQHNRAALLSPSQKKANHIQSEQKRRANIRRGYDALCDMVPALREACQAEEERTFANGKSRRRRGKGRSACDDGEKTDGRAGPRSENVVLSKSAFYIHILYAASLCAVPAIDHVHDLLSEREALLHRLHAAQNVLPPDHPLLQRHPDAPLPLWERKWTGGQCKEGDDDEDEEDED